MTPISIETLKKRKELIELLDQALEHCIDLNRQLADIGDMLIESHEEHKKAA